MTIFELAKLTLIDNALFINYSPFIYTASPATWATGSYWTTAFGAPAESSAQSIEITSFVRDNVFIYSKVESLADCLLIEKSFYWDNANQVLYIHLEHDQSILFPAFKYGSTFGICDKKACYIGGIFYAPILKSIPSLAQSQDFEAYDQLNFISGNVIADNTGGLLDGFLTEECYGYDCYIGYLDDDERDDYDRDEITYLAALYVDDYSASKSEFIWDVKDRRTSQNIKIPTELFDSTTYPNASDDVIGSPIPLAFGLVRVAPAICTNGKTTSGAVSFRIADVLTTMGTVQVKKGDVWTTVATASVSLATGSFTLAEAVGRDASMNIYECQVLDCIGILNTHSSDIIKYLILRYLGVQYTTSEYDTVEWAEAEALLSTVGLLTEGQIELFEVIRQIQAGSNIGFRFEFKPNGQRTIRVNDFDRADSFRICVEDIEDINDIGFSTDKDLLAATVKIWYAKNYQAGSYRMIVDSSQLETVKEAYRQQPQLEFYTLLTTQAAALDRGLADAAKYSIIRKYPSVVVLGDAFLGVRIFDTGIIEATGDFVDADYETVTGSRRWLGIWRAQVLSVDPDLQNKKNTIGLVLIEEVVGSSTLSILADYDGKFLSIEEGVNRFLRVV